jgi:hypothetical protein
MAKNDEGKLGIANVEISPYFDTVGGIKINSLLTRHSAWQAANEEKEDVYSHGTGGKGYIRIRW